MKEFVSPAFLWFMLGIALAILAVNCSSKKTQNKAFGIRIATGAGFGLLFGVVLNSVGLWESNVIGLALGPLWGMALASLFKSKEKSE